jgi:hypothetical protein
MGEPASRTIGALLAIGLAFHLVYIAAVFDCYFTVIVYVQLTVVASTLTGDCGMGRHRVQSFMACKPTARESGERRSALS